MIIRIEGKLQGADMRIVEGFLRSLVEAAGEHVDQVHYHGVYRQRQQDLREASQFRPVGRS